MSPSEYDLFRILVLWMKKGGALQIERYSLTSESAFEALRNHLLESHLPGQMAECWWMGAERYTTTGWKDAGSRWHNREKFLEYLGRFPMSFPARLCKESDRLILKTDTWPAPKNN